MPVTQTILFTAIPCSLRLDPATLPVSVLVSPRLAGADHLGAFPEWLEWTSLCQRSGLRITFQCENRTLTLNVPAAGTLRPRLWRSLFDSDTFVRSHEFNDYSDRFIASFPVRSALGCLKATYQAAGIVLAQPGAPGDPRESQGRRREIFGSLVRGYGMHWSADQGARWREAQRLRQRGMFKSGRGFAAQRATLRNLVDEQGQIRTGTLPPGSPAFSGVQQDLVERFGVFGHMPAGAPLKRTSLDESTVLDFHQALTSLNNYRELQRLLGLAFDVELPLDFLAPTGSQAGKLSIVAVDGFWGPDVPTSVPVTTTAYLLASVAGKRVFALAPRQSATTDQPFGMLGLLNLDRADYGLAQLDVDGGLHKMTMLGDATVAPSGQAPAQHPEVFDPVTTLSSLRSGGISLFADARAARLLDDFQRSKAFNDVLTGSTPQTEPFCAEDLVRGFRIDIWDSVTQDWHSLHRKNSTYHIGDPAQAVTVDDEEGFVQLAATQAAPNADGTRDNDDLYLHEAVLRWNGWSLSADSIGKHLTRSPDPDKAVPDPANPDPENEPLTPFKVVVKSPVVPGTLPRLRFGVGYRLRARVVDLAGNSLKLGDEETKLITSALSLPQGSAVSPYLRFEPIVAPAIVLRDARGVTGPGSSADRLVIRTFNTDASLDVAAADLSAADRHIAPPRTSVELGERHGMFDDATGKLNPSAALWQLIKDRDEGKFAEVALPELAIDGAPLVVPLEPALRLDSLPYLPDPLARAAAFRNLPGAPAGSLARVAPGAGPEQAVAYQPLPSPNPRPGSATLVEFGGRDDWQWVKPFRLALADGTGPPRWDPAQRLLSVFLPKGRTHVVAMSACCDAEDLKVMAVWGWLREQIEFLTTKQIEDEFYQQIELKDRIAQVLQLAQEGGHWMLTPPHLLTLVHAVQQPIGHPQFTPLAAQFGTHTQLRTEPESQPTAGTELSVASSWRKLGGTDAWLVGALRVHGASTAKVDIRAEWSDPVDDLNTAAPGEQSFSGHVDEVPIPALTERELKAADGARSVGYYDADHDMLCFAPASTLLGNLASGAMLGSDAAPCHRIGDTRHHVIRYTAVSTSRYREYFSPEDAGQPRDFTRSSDSVTVDVPASARPVAPQVLYVVPTFEWQRDIGTNQKRSVRMGGTVRIYLDRPWFSSGAGELLGVSLWSGGSRDPEASKPFVTQWGQDPIRASTALPDFPATANFTDAVATEQSLPLDALQSETGAPWQVAVAGHTVHFDETRKLWYCDMTIDTRQPVYAPFVRLALVRYQPHALIEAKLSRVVLADFAQLTPERAVMLTADPHVRGRMRLAVSGPVARPSAATRPNVITVSVQTRDATLASDLGWIAASTFVIEPDAPDPAHPVPPDFILWSGGIRSLEPPASLQPNQHRLLIEEHEVYVADSSDGTTVARRLIYAETIALDEALLNAAPAAASRTSVD